MSQIAEQLQLNRRRFDKWLKWGTVPERNRMEPRPGLAESFREYLWMRWSSGARNGRALFSEIRQQGYVGSYSWLAQLLSQWRRTTIDENTTKQPQSVAAAKPQRVCDTTDIVTRPPVPWRRQVSPQVAAILLGKPRPKLTARQGEIVDFLKRDCPGFAAMRTLTLSFRGILQNGKVSTLHRWMDQANSSGIHSLQQFARTLRRDLRAVEAAILQSWNNGPVEGQVNRLKTLKRQMYGRAGIELLRARMLPLCAD